MPDPMSLCATSVAWSEKKMLAHHHALRDMRPRAQLVKEDAKLMTMK